MVGDVTRTGPGEHPRRSYPPANTPAKGRGQQLEWIPVALGTAALLAGFGGRNRSALSPALTALAGVAAVAAVRGIQIDRGNPDNGRHAAPRRETEGKSAITIGKGADELYRRWRDPETLTRIMAGFATLRAIGDGRMLWTVKGPLGRVYEWDSETVDSRPGVSIGWRSRPDASFANEGSIRFRAAPPDRGTVATLQFRFDPPGGALGDDFLKVLGTTSLDQVANSMLRRFKSLVETGELPTTERQPAARTDTR